jgi:hypothetical protein
MYYNLPCLAASQIDDHVSAFARLVSRLLFNVSPETRVSGFNKSQACIIWLFLVLIKLQQQWLSQPTLGGGPHAVK